VTTPPPDTVALARSLARSLGKRAAVVPTADGASMFDLFDALGTQSEAPDDSIFSVYYRRSNECWDDCGMQYNCFFTGCPTCVRVRPPEECSARRAKITPPKGC
jgi:hypothetical protein